MKVLITHASAGAGHRKAAETIYNYFKEKSPQDDVKLIDVLDKTNKLFKNAYTYGYLYLVNHFIWLWSFLFWITSIKWLKPFNSGCSILINRLNSKNFLNYLINEQPDIIISTHFLPPELAGYLKRKNKIKSKIITVITDYGVHPYWINNGTDIYIAASSFTKAQLIEKGISEDSIQELGIPVDAKFSEKLDKISLRKKFGLKIDSFTVLITTGSFGIGPVVEIVRALYKEVQLIVICAKNQRLYNKLKTKNFPNVLALGFIDNIEEVMAASDIVIAKPGGLTISEILTIGATPIFIYPIPGQETKNIEAMARFGIGKFARSVLDIENAVIEYKRRPEKLEKNKLAINLIKKPFAAKDLYDAICQGCSRA